ncbi:endonuclease/exonuclease/phosphatase family protein [Arthrobacter sp. KBS0702]|uniref:endonuclease/exonuclease/phosphatase family protein n=1 Tax=Arthrobacter sp. KBS0702 TaxID=2578107 RepID=UPI001C94F030|nr:endonuclease/exonuclease/phosphatase family protein [Arthrobacter sp. KBS0702]
MPSDTESTARTVLTEPDADPGPAGPSADPAALSLMSFNIRCDIPATLPGQADYWPERVPALQAVLAEELPEVLGIQEGLEHQLAVIEEALPEHYRMIGHGREGGSRGEHSCIFYDSRRLRLHEWDQFWLSDTPTVPGSATWGNDVTRIATWGRFEDNCTGRELMVVNTHFDHESENAQLRSAEAIIEHATRGPALPTVLMGDFNADAGASGAYSTLVGSGAFRDSWTAAQQRLTPEYGTFPNYKDPVIGESRIDWIAVTPDIQVAEAAVNTFRLDDRYPSDHAPIQATVRIQ